MPAVYLDQQLLILNDESHHRDDWGEPWLKRPLLIESTSRPFFSVRFISQDRRCNNRARFLFNPSTSDCLFSQHKRPADVFHSSSTRRRSMANNWKRWQIDDCSRQQTGHHSARIKQPSFSLLFSTFFQTRLDCMLVLFYDSQPTDIVVQQSCTLTHLQARLDWLTRIFN